MAHIKDTVICVEEDCYVVTEEARERVLEQHRRAVLTSQSELQGPDIRLPDGRIIKVKYWGESSPPQPFYPHTSPHFLTTPRGLTVDAVLAPEIKPVRTQQT